MADYPNQCIGCGGPISWSRWFCNWCAEREGLTVALGMAPSKPKAKRHELIDGTGGGSDA